MHIEIRLAGKDDIGKIHDILSEMAQCDMGLRDIKYRESLDCPFCSYLLALSGEKVIGYLNMWHFPDVVDGGVAGIILDCYVLGEYRSRGVGKMLMESAMDLGKRHKVDKYYLWVDPRNEAAVTLFKKFGFFSGSLMLEKKD